MGKLLEWIAIGVAIIVLQGVAAIAVFLIVNDIPIAAIVALPVITPIMNYRSYTDLDRFDYDQYRTERSLAQRGGEAIIASVLAGLVGVPVGVAVYVFAPISGFPGVTVAYFTELVVVFVVGSLVSFRLNRKYLKVSR